MRRLRWRLARLLVGPFVNLPAEDGVWVVTQTNSGRVVVTYRADKFRLKMSLKRAPWPDTFDNAVYTASRRVGRFVGTIDS